MIKIAPSILSADFANLERDIRLIAEADYIHVDVMDGCFVPNITIGAPVVKALRPVTDLVLDVHLMIDRPVRYIPDFLKAGSDIITLHTEADTPEEISRALSLIRAGGARAGLSIKPATPAQALLPWLDSLDLILIMTVEPGFGGQSFQYEQMPKLLEVRTLLEQRNPACELSVDGGISLETAPLAVQNGANVLVAGSAVYGASDIPGRIRDLRAAAQRV